MNLLERIKHDSVAARKIKYTLAASLLTTLYAEAASIGKNNGNRETTDAEVIAIIKKFIKNGVDTKSHLGHTSDAFKVVEDELTILNGYLPKQMTTDELSIIIKEILMVNVPSMEFSQKHMGIVMKTLKTAYDGQYDGDTASKVFRDLVNVKSN